MSSSQTVLPSMDLSILSPIVYFVSQRTTSLMQLEISFPINITKFNNFIFIDWTLFLSNNNYFTRQPTAFLAKLDNVTKLSTIFLDRTFTLSNNHYSTRPPKAFFAWFIVPNLPTRLSPGSLGDGGDPGAVVDADYNNNTISVNGVDNW